VSTALLHLVFFFPLLIVVFLTALNVVGLVPICRCKGGRFMSFKGAFGLVHFSSSLYLLQKAVHVIGLVPVCHCKGGRRMSLRKAFGPVPFPRLFFTLSSSQGSECGRASTYLSLQGW
jgi:hypothetical protein